MGPRPAGPTSQALMFFESFKRMRLAHSSRKGLTRVIGAQLTSPGAMLGTVAYMSPAQVKAKELDVRTDLFSFGSVPYEMGTAKTPFDGSSAGDVCGLIVQQDPVPLSRV